MRYVNGVAVMTIFARSGGVDRKGMAAHLERLASQGLDLMVAGWGCGELLTMSTEDTATVLRLAHDVARTTGVRAMAQGLAAATAREQVDYVDLVEASGLNSVIVYPPGGYHSIAYTDEELRGYYDAVLGEVSRSTSVALSMYNPGGRYPRSVPRLYEWLIRKYDNIWGIQGGRQDDALLSELMTLVGPDIAVWSGGAVNAFTNLALGGSGFICAESNVVPGLAARLVSAHASGDPQGVTEAFRRMLRMRRLHINYGFVRSMKAMLDMRGLPGGPPNPPMLPLPGSARSELERDLDALGITAAELGLRDQTATEA